MRGEGEGCHPFRLGQGAAPTASAMYECMHTCTAAPAASVKEGSVELYGSAHGVARTHVLGLA